MKIFFATDIHGSEICFKKLLNAGKFYKADTVILGGDMTGKMVVPIIKKPNGTYTSQIIDRNFILKSTEELKTYTEDLKNMGLYPYMSDEDEMEALKVNKIAANEIFERLIKERLTNWVGLADKKFKPENQRLFVCPGNDDDYYIDHILKESLSIVNLENSVFDLSDDCQVLSTGHSNLTPWNTPREISETDLDMILKRLAKDVNNDKSVIYNIHVPPYNTRIDECAELDSEFRAVTSLGQVIKKPVGSTAVRKAIEENQPLLGLFGHVHEGKGEYKIGKTLCLNPGSNYQEGILNGVIVSIVGKKITGYQFITG